MMRCIAQQLPLAGTTDVFNLDRCVEDAEMVFQFVIDLLPYFVRGLVCIRLH